MNFRSFLAGSIAVVCWINPGTAWQADPGAASGSPGVQQSEPNGAPAIGSQASAAQPSMPPGFPLDSETQEYIEKLLAYWEGTSDQVTHYQCSFTRWQYDQEVCNWRRPDNNHLVAAEISRGNIRYRKPDKGMYEVAEKWSFAGPPEAPGLDPKYERRKLANPNFPEQEKWICDGESIFEYDFETSRLYEIRLPPESQGEGLKNSPLPFVFGARAVELLDRYWIRDITPAGVQDQYWLEAWPRRIGDAQNYSKIEIILSRDPFLPLSIHMYAPNYDIKSNPSRMVFEFEQREINGTLVSLPIFDKFFIRPTTPLGWKRVERDMTAEVQPGRLGQESSDELNRR